MDEATTSIKITGNTASSGTTNNVYLVSTALVAVQSALPSGSAVGVTLQNGTGAFTTAGAQAADAFTSDSYLYAVQEDSTTAPYTYSFVAAQASVTVGGVSTSYATLTEALAKAIAASTDPSASMPATVTLISNVALAGADTLAVNAGDITLDLAGHALTSASDTILTVGAGATLAIVDDSTAGTGSITGDVAVESDASLTVSGKATITGDVAVASGASLNLSDTATITGDVAVEKGATVTLSGAVSVTGTKGITLADGASLAVSGSLSDADIIFTTETEPTSAQSPITVATQASSYSITDTDLAAFTSSTTSGITLVRIETAGSNSIALALAPTFGVTADVDATTTAAPAFALASDDEVSYRVTDDAGNAVDESAYSVATDDSGNTILTLLAGGTYHVAAVSAVSGAVSEIAVLTVYSVTFDYASNMLVNALEEGDTAMAIITLPSANSRSGYTFKGWSEGGDAAILAGEVVTITGDTTYAATWKKKSSSSVSVSSGSVSSSSASSAEAPTSPATGAQAPSLLWALCAMALTATTIAIVTKRKKEEE